MFITVISLWMKSRYPVSYNQEIMHKEKTEEEGFYSHERGRASPPLLNELQLLFLFFFFCLFRATPTANGGSQAKGQIGAVAASLPHSHSNAGSKLNLRPTPQLKATSDP